MMKDIVTPGGLEHKKGSVYLRTMVRAVQPVNSKPSRRSVLCCTKRVNLLILA